jgi:hypothetical protein
MLAAALAAGSAVADERERQMQALLGRAEFPETTLAQMQQEIAELTGVPFLAPVDVEYVDAEGLSRYLSELVDEEYPEPDAAIDERLLRALDLLPMDTTLRSLRVQLMEENVLGFYDTRPEHRRLFAVSAHERLDPANQMVLAHELRHALQDQHLQLHALLSKEVSDFDDRTLALLSLFEGDATFVMEHYLRQRVPEQRRRPLVPLAKGPLPPVQGAPAVLRDQLVMPYIRGRDFVLHLWQREGWAGVRRAWDAPPESTEQVLHPERYDERDRPITVQVPAGPEGALPLRTGVLGELLVSSLLGCEGGACTGAAGWGGDAYGLWDVDGRTHLSWSTAWDTPADADEFWEALLQRFDARYEVATISVDARCYQDGPWRFVLERVPERVRLTSSDVADLSCADAPLDSAGHGSR